MQETLGSVDSKAKAVKSLAEGLRIAPYQVYEVLMGLASDLRALLDKVKKLTKGQTKARIEKFYPATVKVLKHLEWLSDVQHHELPLVRVMDLLGRIQFASEYADAPGRLESDLADPVVVLAYLEEELSEILESDPQDDPLIIPVESLPWLPAEALAGEPWDRVAQDGPWCTEPPVYESEMEEIFARR